MMRRKIMGDNLRTSNPDRAVNIAARIESFVREKIIPYEQDARWGSHGPSMAMVAELRDCARSHGVLSPHVGEDGSWLTHREMGPVLRAAGLSPLGPVALNAAAPDEGNMYMLHRLASEAQKRRFLVPLIEGRVRSAFMMTEPADEGGAGSDPSMLQTAAVREDCGWVVNGRKCFATGVDGAGVGILMAKSPNGATMFIFDLPNPAVRIERIMDTIDSTMPGGHGVVTITALQLTDDDVLGEEGKGLQYAQVRLAPARLTHCMRWLGACVRAQEIATAYAVKRMAFGKLLIDHEGVGFMLADNRIELQSTRLMIDWCAGVLDAGEPGIAESSMTKVAVSEALFRVADRCVQVMGGSGVDRDRVVERVFREVRAFRIYDGPTEVHKWSIAKKIKREAGG
jgi:acyl-CoA dehydrogenase